MIAIILAWSKNFQETGVIGAPGVGAPKHVALAFALVTEHAMAMDVWELQWSNMHVTLVCVQVWCFLFCWFRVRTVSNTIAGSFGFDKVIGVF